MSDNPQELQQVYHATLNKMQSLKDQMAAQGLLVKDEPHAALYISKTRELMTQRDRQGLHVLIEIANHADEMGWCFPSVQTIGQMAGYSPGTVEMAISRLMKKDWLRVHMVFNPRRKRYEKDFVVSPAVLYIRPEIRQEAWQRFVDTKHFDSWEQLKLSVTQNIKPTPEPATATNSMNQLHEPTPEPAPAASRKAGSAKTQNGANHDLQNSAIAQTHDDTTNQATNNANNSVSNSEANPTGHTSPPVPAHPPLPSGFDPKEALPDAQDEQAAQRIHTMFPTLQLRVARQYVARYDRDTVLLTAQIAKEAPHIRNPVGKLDNDLRRSLTDPQDEITPKSKYLTGESSAFIEH